MLMFPHKTVLSENQDSCFEYKWQLNTVLEQEDSRCTELEWKLYNCFFKVYT